MVRASREILKPTSGLVPGFRVTPTGLEIVEAPTRKEWDEAGRILRQFSEALHWYIGDWLNAAPGEWGEMYDEAAKITGFKPQTLRIDKHVAARIESFRRLNNLSWSHHFKVAPFAPQVQDQLLAAASRDRLSLRDFDKAIEAHKNAKAEPDAEPDEVAIPAELADRFTVDQGDCLEWLRDQPEDCFDLVFGSPPYEDARLYLEGGKNLGVARGTREWVAWMVDVYKAALRCCKGLVAFVVEGRTEDYEWTASPALLIAALVDAGITVRKPPIYKRVGIPGSGGNKAQHAANGGGADWLRNDYEFVICATRGGKLPWADACVMGKPCAWEPGGDPTHRVQDGSRVNADGTGYASMDDRNNVGPHRARQRAGRVYQPPEVANPGNVIECAAGGGNMGDRLCHENEAPFPESLAEFFVRSFCRADGVVCDPFSGSGTTGAVAVRHNRFFRGCDLRESQVALSKRRIARVQRLLPVVGD